MCKYLNPNVGSGTYISYADKYYNETYSFKYLDQRYALARDSESNLLNKIVITYNKFSSIVLDDNIFW